MEVYVWVGGFFFGGGRDENNEILYFQGKKIKNMNPDLTYFIIDNSDLIITFPSVNLLRGRFISLNFIRCIFLSCTDNDMCSATRHVCPALPTYTALSSEAVSLSTVITIIFFVDIYYSNQFFCFNVVILSVYWPSQISLIYGYNFLPRSDLQLDLMHLCSDSLFVV